jgi:hypothetical protein
MSLENPNQQPSAESQKPKTPEEIQADCRRCLESMRAELADGRLERLEQLGAWLDRSQTAVAQFFLDYVQDDESFKADPKAWAEQLRAAGKVEEIQARLVEIDGLLKPTGFEGIESNSNVWDELGKMGEAGQWLMHGKLLFSTTTHRFSAVFEDLLDGQAEASVAATLIFNVYGQAKRAENWDQPIDYLVPQSPEQQARPKLLRGWASECLDTLPNWWRSGIETVALCEKRDLGNGRYRGGGYQASTKLMDLSAMANTRTVVHEGGHAVDADPRNLNKLDSRLRATFMKAVLEEEAKYSYYVAVTYAENGAELGLKEDFADAWSFFLTAPEYFENTAPVRYAALEEITEALGLDVKALRKKLAEAEASRVGDPEKAKAVFEIYGWSWMSSHHQLPGRAYASSRCALPGWQRNQASRKETNGRGREKLLVAEHDKQGRLRGVLNDGEEIFDAPTYDELGRLTSYRADNQRYEVRYDKGDEMPTEVWCSIDDRGTLAKIADFRREDGRVIQVISMSGGRTWEFVHEHDEAGSLMETTVAYNGQAICRQSREKDEQGRISFFANIDLDDQVPTPDDEITIEYED